MNVKRVMIPLFFAAASACFPRVKSIPLRPSNETDSGITSSDDSGNNYETDSATETGITYTNSPISILSAGQITGNVYQSEEATLEATATIEDADLETEHGDSHTATLTVDASLEALVAGTAAAVSGTQVDYQITFAQIPWTSYSSGTIEGSATLTVCDAAVSCASQTIAVTGYKEEITAAYSAAQDVKVLEQNPTINYEASSLIIGTSTSGRERSLVSFDVSDIADVYVTDAAMTVYATSGTCRSSTNNQNCEQDMIAELYEPTASWDAATATWESAGDSYNAALLGQTETINLPYGGSGSYDISIMSVVQQWVSGTNTGLLLKNSEEVTSGDQQVDVTLGSLESGSAATMNVSYWK